MKYTIMALVFVALLLGGAVTARPQMFKRLREVVSSRQIFAKRAAPPAVVQTQLGETYSSAKEHTHGKTKQGVFTFVSRQVTTDPANNPGNGFLGNQITVKDRDGREHKFWHDFSADLSSSVVFLSMVSSRSTVLVTYDPACKMALKLEII